MNLQNITSTINTVTISSGVGSSAWGALEYWNFIGSNSAAIGILLTLFFGFVAIIFNVLNAIRIGKANNNAASIIALTDKITVITEEVSAIKILIKGETND